jgi:SET and MYND domain-containing protein
MISIEGKMNNLQLNGYPLEVRKTKVKGRCFLSNRDINEGELILQSNPYAFVPDSSNINSVCTFCLKPNISEPLKCDSCANVSYCTLSCKSNDFLIHKLECEFWDSFLSQGLSSLSSCSDLFYTLDYIRLLIRCICRKKIESENPHHFSDGFLFENLRDLHLGKFGKLRQKEFRIVADILSEFAKTLGIHEFTLDDFFDFVCKEECNSFGIYTYEKKGRIPLGLGLYFNAVFFNHSCIPNVVHSTKGPVEYFYALRSIKKGEELTISYISLKENTVCRMEKLREYFLFSCDCARCINENDPEVQEMLKDYNCKDINCNGFYIPEMYNDVNHVIWKCEACKKSKI